MSENKSFNIFFPDRTIPLHSMLLNCGHQTADSTDYSWDGLKRGAKEFVIFQYTLSGQGALTLHRKNHTLTAGTAMLLLVPSEHCYYLPDSSKEWEFIYVSLYGSEVIRLAREIVRQHGNIFDFAPDSLSVANLYNIFQCCAEGKLKDKYSASRLAYSFIIELLQELSSRNLALEQRPEFISLIYEYCMANLHRRINVAQLAKLAGYSRFYFTRQFTRFQGVSPQRFLMELRLKLAVRMLQNEPLSIKEISDRCGFEDVSYFCKVFKKHHHLTPDEYRGRR